VLYCYHRDWSALICDSKETQVGAKYTVLKCVSFVLCRHGVLSVLFRFRYDSVNVFGRSHEIVKSGSICSSYVIFSIHGNY